ncbi:glycosyltransferase [Lentzea sp. NPDC051838]|uniref:glycosyltransferase n=1 Tax=Lentzea sp. NPDC051838 TaxID=3154849 RepID=UPI0034135164
MFTEIDGRPVVKVLLVAHGTRGDVQLLLSLAIALSKAGHDALLAAPLSFGDSIRAHDVEFAPLDDRPNRLLDDPVLREAIEGGYRGVRGKITALSTIKRIKPLMADVEVPVPDGAAAEGASVPQPRHLPHGLGHAARLLGCRQRLAHRRPRPSPRRRAAAGARAAGVQPAGHTGRPGLAGFRAHQRILVRARSELGATHARYGRRTSASPHRKLTADALATAIGRALTLRQRADDLGERIRAENGVAKTVRDLEEVHSGRRVQRS